MPDERPNDELIAVIREGIDSDSGAYELQQAAEVALNELHERIKGMNELLVQANDTPEKLRQANRRIEKLHEVIAESTEHKVRERFEEINRGR